MLFSTDKQTLEDLNIFGKHGSDSIFNLFNRCITRGGAAILEELFRYPLQNAEAINGRLAIIKYFATSNPDFPFQGNWFDAAEQYLANTDERTRLVAEEHSISKKIGSLLSPDAETAIIYKGVTAITELLNALQQFIASLTGDTHPLRHEKDSITALLATNGFAEVLQRGKSKLTHQTIAAYDALFRFAQRFAVQKLLRHMYMIDAYCSVARVAKDKGYIFPNALPAGSLQLKLEGVYHPQVKNAVPNTLHVVPGKNVLFLTGANMAGKSTFMKSLSIALFLAHIGFPVAARQMEFTVMDGIYTTINLPDNLGMGASHFYAEVLRVKKMAMELGQQKNLFIVFDELFRGTNVKDAYEATIAVTEAFARKTNSLFIISTHIIEAGDILKQRCPNVRFIYLPTRMNGNHPVYTYTLEEGITNDRHGMVIINNEGILDILEAGIKKGAIV